MNRTTAGLTDIGSAIGEDSGSAEGSALHRAIPRYVIAGVAIVMIALLVFTMATRAGYPYELEWMEGGSVDHSGRLLDGEQLYAEPSIEFTAYTYTPLYFYTGAFSAKVFGLDFFALRLVSVVATLATMALIFLFVRRESGSALFGLLGAGLFAGAYSITGFWFDLARPDMLFLALMLATGYLLRFHDGAGMLALAGLLAFLAFMAKQTALLVALPLAACCLFTLSGRKRFIFPAVLALLTTASIIILEIVSGGWFYYYVFHLPGQHMIDRDYLMDFPHFIYRFSIAVALAFAYLATRLVKKSTRRMAWFDAVFFLSMLFASWVVSIHEGSFENVLIPGAAVIAIYSALGANTIMEDPGVTGAREARFFLPVLGALLVLLQVLPLLYAPGDQKPSDADRAAGDGLVAKLREADGAVFVPFHGHLATMAGKEPSAHGVAIGDVIAGGGEEAQTLQRGIDAAIAGGEYELVVLDRRLDQGLAEWFGMGAGTVARLEYVEPAIGAADIFLPMTGMITRPEAIYRFEERA